MTLGLISFQACGGRALDLDRTPTGTTTTTMTGVETISLPEQILEVWVDESRLYWLTASNKLQGCEKTNCPKTTLTYASGVYQDAAIAGGHVYWISPAGDTIYSCPSAGCAGTPTRVVQDIELQNPALSCLDNVDSCFAGHSGFSEVPNRNCSYCSRKVSADGEYVYWVSTLDIYRCLYSGCGPAPELVAAQSRTFAVLSFQGTDAFWLDGDGVYRAPKDGSGPPSLVVAEAAAAYEFATDAASIYWLAGTDSTSVFRCPLSGCGGVAPVALAATDVRESEFQVDTSGIYWAAQQLPIHSCPLTGCGSNATNVTTAGVYTFALDESYVYWSDGFTTQAGIGRSIHRMPK